MAGEGMKFFLQTDTMLTEVLTIRLAAYRYNFSMRTIQKWCDEGKLIAYEFEGRWLIPISELERYVTTKDFYHQTMGQYE